MTEPNGSNEEINLVTKGCGKAVKKNQTTRTSGTIMDSNVTS